MRSIVALRKLKQVWLVPADTPPTPTVVSVTPANGAAGGGTSVTVKGTGFQYPKSSLHTYDLTKIIFGANAATNLVVTSPTTATCTTPAGPAGLCDVGAVGPGGRSFAIGAFTYGLPPTLTNVLNGISTSVGDIDGGYTVTLNGLSFTGVTSVTFGGTSASFSFVSDTVITATVPAHASGVVDVIVTTPSGSNAAGNNAWEYFSPAQLTLTGWWRDYPGSLPWSGVASAGGSGGRQWTSASHDPSSGSSVNGHTPASFNGTNSQMTSSLAPSTLFSTTGATIVVLFNCAATFTDDTFWYDAPPFVTEPSSRLGVAISSSGVFMGNYDGSSFDRLTPIAVSNSAWHLVQMTHDGATIRGRVDNGSFSTKSRNASVFAADTVQSGIDGGSSSHFYNGLMLEIICNNAVIADATLDKIRGYSATRYGVSV